MSIQRIVSFLKKNGVIVIVIGMTSMGGWLAMLGALENEELLTFIGSVIVLMSLSLNMVIIRREQRFENSAANRAKEQTVASRDQRPPRLAMYLLRFLPMPRVQREATLGDLEEEFNDILGQFGPRKARIWYGAQVLRSFWPIISGWFKKLLGWGILGWIGSAIRHLIS